MCIVAAACLLASLPLSRAADADTKPAENKSAAPGKAAVRDRLQQISEELKLTDDQKEKLKPIFREEAGKLRELRNDKDLSREDRAAKIKTIRDDAAAKVKPILTPEQLEKWNKLHSEGPRRRRQE